MRTETVAPNHEAPRRYLIVNADDLGLTDGVTQAIAQAWHKGIVTSTSALVNIKGAPERIRAIHRAYPRMPIGLHLNITLGRPVLPAHKVPSLVDGAGSFHTSKGITTRLLSISLSELRAELRAQAAALMEIGVSISHLDYHNHMVALYTPFYQTVRELAKELQVPVRQPVPESVYKRVRFRGGTGTGAVVWQMVRFGMRHPIAGFKLMPHMNPAAYKEQSRLLAQEGILAPDWFIDGYFGHAETEQFIHMLRQLPPGVSEVAVHPGIVDETLLQLDPEYARRRPDELAVLLDPKVREAASELGVELVSYDFLRNRGAHLDLRPTANAGEGDRT